MKRTLYGLLLLPLALGCRGNSEPEVRDTEGRKVRLQCDGSGKCAATGMPLTLRSAGRLMALCDAASTDPRDCRALVCSDDGDCPNAQRASRGSCVNGLCIEPTNQLAPADAVALCLAGTGLGKDAPLQVERYAMALNCGSPCTVPKPCRQP
jgi:hypothetical protein